MTPETLALVSAVVAFLSAVGSVASAIVSNLNGKRQQNTALMGLVMPMREAWIDKLREKVAWLIAQTSRAQRRKDLAAELDAQLALTLTEVGLMLNVAESDQQELMESLKALSAAMNDERAAFDEVAKRAVAAARRVLGSEWQRAKAAKP